MKRQLVVNADDFGFTTDVNQGIVEAHRDGILTSTTLMANGEAFEDAVRLAKETPSLDIGCHLTLIGGRSLVTGRPYPLSAPQLIRAIARKELQLYEELAAQTLRIISAGLRPSHLDTHKHTHLAPPVLDAVARVSEKFGIRWVRRPFDFPLDGFTGPIPAMKRITSQALGMLRRRFHRVLEQHGCRVTDHFAGFQITGRFHVAELLNLLEILPAGSTELMCHPGRCGDALRKARTRLKESRERELEALIARETRDAVDRLGIELSGFNSLG